jgi:hypothetical protein
MADRPVRFGVLNTLKIQLLERYRVDRASGQTADGSTQLVVLVVKASGERELAVALSKVDAMVIAHQLIAAAGDAQSTG